MTSQLSLPFNFSYPKQKQFDGSIFM